MNNIEENAIKIAELLGYKTNGIYTFGGQWYYKDEIRELFSSYNELMPIVFECNSGYSYGITIRTEDIIFHNYTKEKVYFNHDTEPEFIEAIQLACVKYLELKNAKQNKT